MIVEYLDTLSSGYKDVSVEFSMRICADDGQVTIGMNVYRSGSDDCDDAIALVCQVDVLKAMMRNWARLIRMAEACEVHD